MASSGSEISTSDNGNRELESPVITSSSTTSPRPVRRGATRRGRGRPRGRGAGRVTKRVSRRGRGSRSARGDSNRAEQALQLTQSRQEQLKNLITELDDGEAKRILLKVGERHPSLILDLLKPAAPGPGGYHPPPTASSPPWCTCTRCREMPTQQENLCCGHNAEHCISQLADFSVLILDEAVLAIARLHRNDMLAMEELDDYNKANRHAAYRQFILWQHGRLGSGIRRVIPSCCVWKI